jgi:hypothetical protein
VASLEISSETPQTVVSGFSRFLRNPKGTLASSTRSRQSASEAEARWADFSRAKD